MNILNKFKNIMKRTQSKVIWLFKIITKPNELDIDSRYPYPSGELSNFAAHEFEIDNIKCASMEGFLQSLKFKDIKEQEYICSLVGKEAKRAGMNVNWKDEQVLWWRGKAISRQSNKYQELIDMAYESLGRNTEFIRALISTNNKTLTHSIGAKDPKETILTEKELCDRLTSIRDKYKRI
jgi:predicted NAD-dependent protein-ADP-ribosyltransferase YbiA (DUF1768 family)